MAKGYAVGRVDDDNRFIINLKSISLLVGAISGALTIAVVLGTISINYITDSRLKDIEVEMLRHEQRTHLGSATADQHMALRSEVRDNAKSIEQLVKTVDALVVKWDKYAEAMFNAHHSPGG